MREEGRDAADVAAELWPDAYAGVRAGAGNEVRVVAFTRDPTTLGAELRRRAGADVHVELRPRALRELETLAERIADEEDTFPAVGIHLISCAPDSLRGQVRLEITTEDPPAATAWLLDRYGPAVAVDVFGPRPEIELLVAIEGYEVLDDGCSLRLGWQAGGGARLLRVEIDEHPQAVTVGAIVASNYVVTADWRLGLAETRLNQPLGSRPLLDAKSGQTIRQSLSH